MRMASNYEGGLPSSHDYDPSEIGMADLSAGEPEQAFADFGLEVVPVLMDGNDTGRRVIRRNGEYVTMVSDRYKLLPNEHAAYAAEQVADELGAVPFDDFDGDWYVEMDDHIFQDRQRHRVHALYAWDDPVDVSPDPYETDDIQFGFSVHNSIDGTYSFEVGLFTFRHACANMVTMGLNGNGMNFDDRSVVQHTSQAHTSSLDVEVSELASQIKNMMVVAEDISETYRSWFDEFVSIRQIDDVISRFPKSDLPEWLEDIAETVDDREQAARENDDVVFSDEDRDRLIRGQMPNKTIWNTYNDMTENLWHNDSTSDRTKDRKFTQLHQTFEPAQGVR